MEKLCFNDTYYDLESGAYDQYNGHFVYASVFGSGTNIRMLARQLNQKQRDIRIMRHNDTTVRNGYKIFTAKIPNTDYSHAVIYRKDEAEEIDNTDDSRITAYFFIERPAGEDRTYYAEPTRDGWPYELEEVVYAKLKGDGHFKGLVSFGLIREWMPYLMRNLIDQMQLFPLQMQKPAYSERQDHKELFGYGLHVSNSALQYLIQDGLQRFEIQINGTNTNSEKIDEVEGLNDYLSSFGDIMAREVQDRFTPRFVPEHDSYSKNLNLFCDYVRYHAHINLYPAQKNVIQSVANCLSDQKFAFIAAQMGTGRI